MSELHVVIAHGQSVSPASGLTPEEAVPLALTPQGPVDYGVLEAGAGAELLSWLLDGKPHLRGFLLRQYGQQLVLEEYDHDRQRFDVCLECDLDPPIGRRQRLSPLAERPPTRLRADSAAILRQ